MPRTERGPKEKALDDQGRPAGEGRPPRPKTVPPGAGASTRTPKTDSDPSTGAPSGGKRETA